MDLSGVFFNLLLKNPSEGIEHWNKIKIQHLHEGYLDLYSVINNYYEKNASLPSFANLSASTRSEKIQSKIISLKKLIVEDLELEIVIDALINEHVQTEALTKIEKLVKNITLLDSEEIQVEFNNISIELEEQSANTGSVSTMADLLVATEKEICTDQTLLGINQYIDDEVKVFATELVMLGGARGSGKSIVCSNMSVQQYNTGDVGLYFSIEMRRQEVFNRNLSILSGVSNTKIRNGNLNAEDYYKLALVRKDMFVDTDSIFERYLETRDFRKFELELVKHKKLKENNQLIIVDNQKLTLADIDSILTKQKAIFGSHLKTCQVDYVNQIHLESDQYDWKAQITLSKRLKDLARKHEISIITPYQIDAGNEARFSKGLLDAADMAFVLSTDDNAISFETTKIRSGSPYTTKSSINWDTLEIDPSRISETTSIDSTPITKAKEVSEI
ncbi:MAG: hypothetical protein GY707_05315 [Desulfobacteraceae bacterium]|nr:hypothetical protein [Desulfobacteraceae bacterium]